MQRVSNPILQLPTKREAKPCENVTNNYVKSSNIIWRWNNSRRKHDKTYNKFTFPKFNANRLKITTKLIITLLYIEHFYMDDEKKIDFQYYALIFKF
jgi:hypothetical protein